MLGTFTLDVKPKPDWLINGGSVNSVAVTGSVITMSAVMPIKKITRTVDAGAKFIGDLQFGLKQNDLKFDISYDITIATSTVSNEKLHYSLEVFGEETPIDSITTSSGGFTANVTLDNTFNMVFKTSYRKIANLFEYRTPEIKIPLPIPGLTIGVSAGLKLDGGIKLAANYGKDNSTNNYGFIFGIDTSQIGVAARVEANIRTDIKLLFSRLASAQGNLDLIGRVGLNHNFATQPQFDSTMFGGDLRLEGSIEFFGIASPIAKQFLGGTDIIKGQLWPSGNSTYPFNGGFPNALNSFGFRPLNGTMNTSQANWHSEMPTYMPQPAMSTRNGSLKTVWLEEDTLTGISTLLMSKLDSTKCGFRNSLIVSENNFSMSAPKIASFANGDAIITWSQNKYNVSNLPSGTTLLQFFDAQDIYYAIYDNASDTIIYKTSISDATNVYADGKPDVTAGIGTTGLISFLREDPNANTTDIYYLGINNTAGTWTVTNPTGLPEKIADLAGANYKASLSFADSTHAVAVWINDADDSDSTNNNKIVSYLFNGSTWSNMGDIVGSQNGYNYNDVSLNFNGAYGALVYIYNHTIDTGLVSNNISAEIYNNVIDDWLPANNYFDTDTLQEFYQPTISISDNGVAALVYQTKNIYTDTIPDQGQLNLKVKNLNNLSSTWSSVSAANLKYLCDTNTYIWSLDVSFGHNNVLYVMTQEEDTLVGNNYTPNNGSKFGSPHLNQVLRTVKIDPNTLAVSDAPNPCSTPAGIKEVSSSIEDFLISNYPNPAQDYTIFDYTIKSVAFTKIEIFDMSGNSIDIPLNQKLEIGRYKTLVNISSLSNGVYFYKITINNMSVSKKLIIVK